METDPTHGGGGRATAFSSKGTGGVRREGGSKARAGCKPRATQALLPSHSHCGIPSAARSRSTLVPEGCVGTRECKTQLGLKLHPGGGLILACRATTTDPEAPNCNLGMFLFFNCNHLHWLAQPGPSWSLSLASLGTRLWPQAGHQPRPTYQPVTFPSQLVSPLRCQQTRPRNSGGCLTTLT